MSVPFTDMLGPIIPAKSTLDHMSGALNCGLLLGFRDQLAINFAGMIVSRFCFWEFGFRNFRGLLGQTLVYGSKTPLSALTRSANGFSVYQNEDGIGMRGTQDTDC